MHDPLCVAFEIRRPWPRTGLGGRRYWPAMVTVWHREPGGRDSGEVCSYRSHWRHPWHWKIQVHALQKLRRRLLTRCTWCGGRDAKRDPVNFSHTWDGPRNRWWKGERGLYHNDCSAIHGAHANCICEDPICTDVSAQYGPYGRCARCGKTRAFGRTVEQLDYMRNLATIPAGQRSRGI